MLQCSGRTRIPCLGGGGGANVPPTAGIHTRSKLPLLASATASAPSPSLSAPLAHHVPACGKPTVTNSVVPFQAVAAVSCAAAHRPTEGNLGCLVRVDDDRVGMLRFIGAVQFACGVWCGLELTNDEATGKNDGQVHGVRYFKCPKQRGLMVPLLKVTTIQQEDSEESMISSSGPHSLLITNMSDESTMVNTSVQDSTRILNHARNDTFKKSIEHHYENETFTAVNADKTLHINDATCCNEDATNETLSNNQIKFSKLDSLDETSGKLQTPPCPFGPLIFTKNQNQSTPLNLRTTISNPNIHQPSNSSIDDPNNKRNSLEFEESLGILTPDQMDTITGNGLITIRPSSFFCRSPSTENMVGVWIPPGEGGGALDGAMIGMTQDNTRSCAELSTSDLSPSLGIIDENGLAAAFNLKSLTVSGEHLSLSLDVQQLLDANRCSAGSGSSLVNAFLRADQTPSPEELPLDPTPILLNTVVGVDDDDDEEGDVLMTVGDGGKGAGGEKKNAVGSFIASIISITSLDTGYQGDGEMSRPGSRGADNASSPMTRRPQPRRNMCDPMTDSDFYTESDADCHESDPQNQQSLHHHHHHQPHNRRNSGDRHAQVIDGTLYAADVHSSSASNGNGSSAAGAAVYPDSGREPMDSSGVFTDIEGVTDVFSLNLNRTIVAASPSDSSTQTITDDSQQQVVLKNRGVISGTTCVVKSSSVKTLVNSGGDRSGSERSSASPKAGRLISSAKKDDNGNKYSMAGSASSKKRVAESKVFKDATNINTRNTCGSTAPASSPPVAPTASAPKRQGKWDAVLNKIGKGSRLAEARSLKGVKARVYSSVAASAPNVAKPSPSPGDKAVAVEKIGRGRCIGSTVKSSCATVSAAKSESREREGSAGKAAGTKPRRILRTRTPSAAAAAAKHSNVESSINSSLSDLSGASPAKKHGSLKPQRLGSAKLSPRSVGGNATTIPPPQLQQQPSPKTPTAANNNNINQHPHQQLQGINNNVVNNNNSKNASATPSPVTSRGKQHLQLLTAAAAAEKDRRITAAAGIAASDASVKDSLPTRQHNKHHSSSCNNHSHNIHHDNSSSVSPNATSAQLLNVNNNAIAATLAKGQTTPTIHCSSPPQTRRTQARNLTSTTTAKTAISPQQSRNAQAAEIFRDATRAAEALAVLVQHLVFEVDAFQAPILKQQVMIMRCDVDTARTTCTQLRETIREQNAQFTEAFDCERTKWKAELIQLKKSDTDKLEKVAKERDDLDHVVQTLKSQMQKLQKIHEEQLEILREENDAIRDQLDERNLEIVSLQKHQQRHYIVADRFDKTTYTESVTLNGLIAENYEGDSNSQEVQSLRAVLDLKQAENSELRKVLAETVQKCERLPSVEEKLSTRTARCEDLDLQLKRQREIEQQLLAEIKKLKDSCKDESNQKRRLSQYNEELQWKLKQSKEVISKVIEQATAEEQQQHLSRSTALNSSFSEKNYHNTYASSTSCVGSLSSSPRHPASLDRSNSFRGRSNSNLSEQSVISNTCSSSPTSPKVKGVVTKSDSVSYVLDMEESSDVLASRIVRRSFRTNSSNNAASLSRVAGDNSAHGWSTLSTTPSPKQRSPTNGSTTSAGRRAPSSSVGHGGSETKKYLRSKSMTVHRTSESACSDAATNNAVVTEDEDDDDDDMGVFWQFNPASNNAEGQKKRLLPTNQSSTPCRRYEPPLLRSTSLEPKLETYRHQETDDSDEEQIQLPALPRQGTVLPPPRHLATDACNSEDDDNSCSSTSSADRL